MVTWTEEDLRNYERKRIHHVSHTQHAAPKLERHPSRTPLEQDKDEETNTGRIKISYSVFRRHLIDPENCCTKFITDALRYEKLIKDDREQDVEIEIQQIKVGSKEQESVKITIQYPINENI